MPDQDTYTQAYSEEGFWDKLQRFAKAAGTEVVEKALLLYYAAQEENAPAWAKATVAGALGYFILPLDAIPDLAPITGYTDDLGVLAIATIALATYINDDVREKARLKLEGWFGTSE
jgi:uncharacterized membrane protein YkvA (DUF1232 family)